VNCEAVNGGRQVLVEFGDKSAYKVHSQWLIDAHPNRRGADYYRTSANHVRKLSLATVQKACVPPDGRQMTLTYDLDGERRREVFEAPWLHAFAPFVGKTLEASGAIRELRGTGSMFDELMPKRKQWRADLDMPTFNAETLVNSIDEQAAFLESMVMTGVALVENVGVPESLDRIPVGRPIYNLARAIIGKFNQHPVRETSWGDMQNTEKSAEHGHDYNMEKPLSMHTDHSVYHGTPGFLQFMHQAQGSVRSKVCDGLALAAHVKKHHPEAWRLLTTVEITHSSRNVLYCRDGKPRNVYDPSVEPVPFELVHTHPIIELNCDGQVEKIVQSETKRGVCALPYDVYEPFMQAYKLWTDLCEDPRFIKDFDWPEGSVIVLNNWRALHGRATVPPGTARTMAFGYINKNLVENRYRLLKQLQTERDHPSLDSQWLTRIPNQVLRGMTSKAQR